MDENIKKINDLLKKIEADEISEKCNEEIHIITLGLENKPSEYLVISGNTYIHGYIDELKKISETKGEKILKEHAAECSDLCYTKSKGTGIGWGNSGGF